MASHMLSLSETTAHGMAALGRAVEKSGPKPVRVRLP